MLFDDAGIVCSTLDTADAIAQGGSPAWVYQLTFPPTYLTLHQRGSAHVPHAGSLLRVRDLRAASGGLRHRDRCRRRRALGRHAERLGLVRADRCAVDDTGVAGVRADDAGRSRQRLGAPVRQAQHPRSPATLFRSGRCAALFPVANQLDPDRDVATSDEDNCPVTTNTSQADAELDSVGDACDNCRNVANPRVAADFLTANPWATLTGGQRDDDHDGYGNKCDGKFPGVTGLFVSNGDLDRVAHQQHQEPHARPVRDRREPPVRDLRPRRDRSLHQQRRPRPVAALEHQAARARSARPARSRAPPGPRGAATDRSLIQL